MVVAQWVGISLSFLLGVAALVVSTRNQRRMDAASDRNDRRAAESNQLAAEANEIAQRALGLAEEQAEAYSIPWELQHESGVMYRLVNNDQLEPAFAVVIDGPNVHQGPVERERVDACSAITFASFEAMGVPRQDVVVTWHRREDRSDEQLTWRHPLPAKSPKPPTTKRR